MNKYTPSKVNTREQVSHKNAAAEGRYNAKGPA